VVVVVEGDGGGGGDGGGDRSCCSSFWAVLPGTVVLTPTVCSTSARLLIDVVSPIIPRPLSGRWPRWLSRQPCLWWWWWWWWGGSDGGNGVDVG